jgi:glycosyltransferase involved in cell wall biosynthesis
MENGKRDLALSVVVPCYNEEGNLRELVGRAVRAMADSGVEDYEILLVDDGSTDGTARVMGELAGEFSPVVPVHHAENRGIVAGWRSGFARSRGRVVLTTDADLQYAPEDIPLLYRECVDGPWDLVQGWRKKYREKSQLRKLLSNGFSVILKLLFFLPIHDVKSGFIAYRREVLEDILDYRFRYFSFQSLPTVAAHFKGYRMKQVPITFHQRFAGESSIERPIIFSIRSALDLPKALVEYRFLKQRRKDRQPLDPSKTAGNPAGRAINNN